MTIGPATFLAALTLFAAAADVRGQLAPVGEELQVHTFTVGSQASAAAAFDARDDLVVVWQSLGEDGDGQGTFGRRYDSAGAPIGAVFPINSYTPEDQSGPAVAMHDDGRFVVAWSSRDQDGSGFGVFARRFDAAGSAIGSDFQVNTYTSASQFLGDVAALPDGGYLIAWHSGQDGSGNSVFAQRYDGQGTPLGVEIPVNLATLGVQRAARIAPGVAAGDAFVIVWEDSSDGSGYGVSMRRFGSAGTAIGGEILVNSYTTANQRSPRIGTGAEGDFVVVWEGNEQSGVERGAFVQRFASNGSKIGTELLVSAGTDVGHDPELGVTRDGRFVVAWRSDGQDGDGSGGRAQRFASTGARLGDEFQLNTYTTGGQSPRSIVLDAEGDAFASWNSGGQDGDSVGVYAQRYLGEVPGLEQPSSLDDAATSDVDASLFAADDFFLQEPDKINQLRVCGGYSPGDLPFADDFDVRVLSDDSGLPGSEIASFVGFSGDRHDTGRAGELTEHCYEMTLPAAIPLAGGHYWLEVSNDSAGSGQTWQWLGGAEDPVTGRPGAATSNDGIIWTGGIGARALEVPFRTLVVADTTFFWGEALWSRQVAERERLDTTPQSLLLADEVDSLPATGQALLGTDVLTFDSSSTGLARGFTVTQLEPNALGWTYGDTELAGGRFALSPNDVDNGEDDDFEIAITDGPPLTALGMTIVSESGGTTPGLQFLSVYGADDELIEALDLARVSFARRYTFLGVVTRQRITRVVFDEDSGPDDIGVQDFRFGVNAAPVFEDGFESGDTTSWTTSTP